MIKLVDLASHHEPLNEEIFAEISAISADSGFIGGPRVSSFETEFSDFLAADAPFVGVSSGTSALEVALWAAGIGPGDEVITQTNTFFATVEAICNVGATPVLVDCELTSGAMNFEDVLRKVSPRTKAVIPVHLFGHIGPVVNLLEWAKPRGIQIVEDASQAHGARLEDGRMAGTLGDLGTFSFFPGKNLGAWGDAGGVSVNRSALAKDVLARRDHGRSDKYLHDSVGTNARMDPIQAAVLRIKLRKLKEWNARRQQVADVYGQELKSRGYSFLRPQDGTVSAWHLMVVRVENRSEVMADLRSRGIETGIHYPVPMHAQPALRDYSLCRGDFPNADRLASESISLPIHGTMSDEHLQRVLEAFMKIARPAEEAA